MLAVDTPTAQVVEALSTAGSALQSCSVEAASEPELRALLGSVRRLQAELDDAVVRIGLRADTLAGEGRSAPAGEVVLGRGEVTGRQACTEAARVDLARRLPVVVASGLSGEPLDALARHTSRLDDDQLARLDIDRLTADATRVPVDTFGASVKRAVDAAIGDGGLAEAESNERPASSVTATDANLAAAALVDLVTGTGPRRAQRPSITVIVDADTLQGGSHGRSVAQTSHGRDLTAAAVARLC